MLLGHFFAGGRLKRNIAEHISREQREEQASEALAKQKETMTNDKCSAAVVEISAAVLVKYSGLGPARKLKRKRLFEGVDSIGEDGGEPKPVVENATYITLADTVLTARCALEDGFAGLGTGPVSVEVIPKIRKGLVSISTKKRGQMAEQIVLALKLSDQQTLERVSQELRIVGRNKPVYSQYFNLKLKPTLSIEIDGQEVLLTLRYIIQALETLYLEYPVDASGCLGGIVEQMAQLPHHDTETITPRMFYDCITEKTQTYPLCNKPPLVPELDTDLLKFQETTVNWMLSREHVRYSDETKTVEDVPLWSEGDDLNTIQERLDSLSFGFELLKLPNHDQPVWYNKYSNNICSQDAALHFLSKEDRPKGHGILSEEMGLGKTVELVALILLNQRPFEQLSETLFDHSRDRVIPKAKTTLIVCPDSILTQWQDEISLHAPSLTVMIYEGSSKYPSKTPSEVANDMTRHDVVITSYSVVSREVHNAMYNPARAKRSRRAVSIKRDLYSEMATEPGEYDQAALDALKEIYDDMNLLTDMVEERPDYSSPLVLLEFWRMVLDEVQMVGKSLSNICKIATLIQRHHSWGASGTPIKHNVDDLSSLLTFMRLSPFGSISTWRKLKRSSHDFKQLFSNLTMRHTKNMVKQDIDIPPQDRVLLSVPFGPIEQNNYDEMYKQLLIDVGLDEMGNPIVPEWEPSPSYYETMRSWLTVLRRLCCHPSFGRESGSMGNRNFQTMDKVLDRMIEDAREKFRETDRAFITSKLEIGQIYEFLKDPTAALSIWSASCFEIESKLRNIEEAPTESSVQNLKSTLELLHRAYFFIASAHYQIYTPPLRELVPGIERQYADRNDVDPELISEDDLVSDNIQVYRVLTKEESANQDLEREFYAKAQQVRRRLLAEPMENVNKSIFNLTGSIEFSPITMQQHKPFGELSIQDFVSRLDAVIIGLNSQSFIMNDWFNEVIKMLKTPLLDTITDPSGEEYAASLNDQEHTSTLLALIQRLIKDREILVMGKDSGETYETLSNAALYDDEYKSSLESVYPTVNIDHSLRLLLISSKELASRNSTSAEFRALTDVIIKLKDAFELQKGLCDKAKKLFRVLNNVYNTKINYFRQLQEISDSVRPFDKKTHRNYNANNNIRELENTISMAKANARSIESRIRYLKSLQSAAIGDESTKMCVICRSAITIGSLTECGHQYCKDCLSEWLKKKQSCPVCKVKIKQSDVYTFTFNRPEINIKLATQEKTDELYQIYQQWDQENLHKLNEIKLKYNHGSKVNIIVRQVLWLKRRDPSVQIVIYSQWSQLLNIIGSSLKHNGVESLSSFNALERFGAGARSSMRKDIALFKKDPRITCFLLNAHAEASGLNLVNATHVFLCEPLVQTGLELQAISRIHRIGQKKPTTVWMFTISGTVEESIVLLSTRKRLEFKERLEEEELAKSASSLVKTSGEYVDSSDLWNSFFSHKIGRLV